MVVDIIGAPGAGKTTVCNRIIRQLQDSCTPYHDMTGRKDTSIWMKLYIRACMLCVRVLPEYRRMYADIENKLAPYPKTVETFFHSDMEIIMRDVVRHVFAHRLYEGRKRVLLNDEGILHKMLPISIQHDVPVEVLLEIYHSFNLDLKLIYVKSDMEQTLQNTLKRNRHDCAYDEMNKIELQEFLVRYYVVLENVLNNEHYEVTDIHTENIYGN